MTHSELVKRATSWLKSHGAVAVCSEPVAWCCVESPDVIGWTYQGASIVIECKVSRSDFLADKKKPHRCNPALGLGNQRFYAAPKGLIGASELPTGWGLIEVSGSGLRQAAPATSQEANLSSERVYLVQFLRYGWRPDWRATHSAEVETLATLEGRDDVGTRLIGEGQLSTEPKAESLKTFALTEPRNTGLTPPQTKDLLIDDSCSRNKAFGTVEFCSNRDSTGSPQI